MNISDWNCSAFECKSTLHTDYWNNSFFGSVCCISGLSFFWFFVDIRWFNFHWNIVVKQYSTLLSRDCDGINVWLAMWLVLLKCYQMCCINWLSCSNPISFYIEVIHPKVCENWSGNMGLRARILFDLDDSHAYSAWAVSISQTML